MALTANTLPSIPPNYALPMDSAMQFASAQTITTTAYINNVNAVVDLGQGRFTGMLALDISAFDQTTGDEVGTIHLFGSNDVAFGNGNVESLLVHDFGAAAHRIVNTILGANFASLPPAGVAGMLFALPFTTFVGGIVYRYVKLYCVGAGTTPSITLSAWISPIEMKV